MEASSNPVLSNKIVDRLRDGVGKQDAMTVNGSLVKTFLLFVVVVASAAFSWGYVANNPNTAGGLTLAGSPVALVLGLVIVFKKPSPALIIPYALAQGVVLGAFSQLFNEAYQGIVLQAIYITIVLTLSMLLLYTSKLVRVTQKFRSIVLIATVGVLFYFLGEFLIGLFAPSFIDTLYSSNVSIVIAAIIVFVASLNLLLDFDFIDKGSERELPKQFEWYAAFGLMVTLIWLYISVLRLLAASRR